MSNSTQTFSHALSEMKKGKVATRESWGGKKQMKLMHPNEWDGAYDIHEPMLMVNEGSGWTVWCFRFHEDVLAEDWIVIG